MEFLDIPIDDVTRDGAVARIRLFLQDDKPHLVTTPNPEMVVDAQRDPAFKAALRKSDLAVPDGAGLVFVSRLMGEPLSERVTGTDLVADIAALAAEEGRSLYLLGAADGIAASAARRLQLEHPGLIIKGAESGGRVRTDADGVPRISEQTLRHVRDAEPDILLVAFGHGTQEKWLAAHLDALPGVRVAIGVGGAFDFIAGRAHRAPAVLRRSGLEWSWRLLTEPWRWRRIFKAVVVFPYLVIRRGR